MSRLHPDQVLFAAERPIPLLAACEHFAGSERLLRKSIELQRQQPGRFDLTADCEDGAKAGREREHIEMIVALLRDHGHPSQRIGVRIHDYAHPHWRDDVDCLIDGAGHQVAYITLPKVMNVGQAAAMIDYVRRGCARLRRARPLPMHVLIETQGALRDVWEIAALPSVETLDFGLMDFISGHQGAIAAAAMRSPEQFEHRLIVRAKAEIAAAALAHGVVPAHNVTLELSDGDCARADARRAREEFGFLRMWSIHPRQIEPIIEGMTPALEGVDTAALILCRAQDADWGPIEHGGQLQDRATYRAAWSLLQRARLLGVPLAAEVEQRFFQTEAAS